MEEKDFREISFGAFLCCFEGLKLKNTMASHGLCIWTAQNKDERGQGLVPIYAYVSMGNSV